MKQAVILCGGKGTRLGADFSHLPKPLVEVAGKPLLDHILDVAARAGISRVILAAGHLGHLIEERYRVHNPWGMEFRVHVEKQALGTAGCLHEIAEWLEEEFALLYGDVFLDFELEALLKKQDAERVVATVLTRQSDHPRDSDLLVLDGEEVVGILPKATRDLEGIYANWGNAAVYACSRELLKFVPKDRASDIATDVFPAVLAGGGRIRAHVLEESGYVKDMGTPARLVEVERYWQRKQAAEEARVRPREIRAVILDRDGVLLRDRGALGDPGKMEFLPQVLEGLAEMKRMGLRCFVATNQPWIARGLVTEEEVGRVHEAMVARIAAAGGRIEAVKVSPFHPETHYGEGVVELRRASECRKPRPGMLFAICEEFGISPAEAVMVGDSRVDVVAAKNAGMRSVVIGGDESALSAGSDGCCTSLGDLVVWISKVNMKYTATHEER